MLTPWFTTSIIIIIIFFKIFSTGTHFFHQIINLLFLQCPVLLFFQLHSHSKSHKEKKNISIISSTYYFHDKNDLTDTNNNNNFTCVTINQFKSKHYFLKWRDNLQLFLAKLYSRLHLVIRKDLKALKLGVPFWNLQQ